MGFQEYIAFTILVPCILSMWPSQLSLCAQMKFIMFLRFIISSSSWLVFMRHIPFSLFGPNIFLKIFLLNTSSLLIINQSIHWHVQNAVIPCRSQEPLPFLPVIQFFLPLLSTDHFSILPHFIQPSVSWSASWFCFQIHIQYSFGKSTFFQVY